MRSLERLNHELVFTIVRGGVGVGLVEIVGDGTTLGEIDSQ